MFLALDRNRAPAAGPHSVLKEAPSHFLQGPSDLPEPQGDFPDTLSDLPPWGSKNFPCDAKQTPTSHCDLPEATMDYLLVILGNFHVTHKWPSETQCLS